MAKKKPVTDTNQSASSKGRKPAVSKATGKPPVSASQNALEDAWGKARQAAPSGGNFEPPDIPDGKYLVQVLNARTAAYKSGSKQGIRFFNINYVIHGQLIDDVADDGSPMTILDTSAQGERVRSQDDLDASREITEGRTPMVLFSERLQLMGIEPPESLAGLPVLAKQMGDPNDEIGKMFLVVNIKNTYKGPDPARSVRPTETLHYQNVYVVEPWPADQAEEFIAEFTAED